ncbi:MAG TPA: phosphoribosyl-ATP diphosphatase [Rhodocyclaceae bacterium]|nr:MAG: phosphoribosyl-ATP diphosphatase [Betaproteobacteria bacterium CG2_30_68_42]HCX32869.1 phosphoribosyl-ATP diphosphatase [Rhodocyclaceae bacterium]
MSDVLQRVAQTLASRRGADPASSYAASLYAKGLDAMCKKVAEEAAETIMAAKDGERLHLVWEVTDLWFHSLVLLSHFGLGAEDVLTEFRRREGISGIEEKAGRGGGPAGGAGQQTGEER